MRVVTHLFFRRFYAAHGDYSRSEMMDTIEMNLIQLTSSQTLLEKMYIEEYLQSKGFTLRDLEDLPPEKEKQLMVEACKYSSYKMAEIESRAKFREKIHTR
jgi:hypothetical protein